MCRPTTCLATSAPADPLSTDTKAATAARVRPLATRPAVRPTAMAPTATGEPAVITALVSVASRLRPPTWTHDATSRSHPVGSAVDGTSQPYTIETATTAAAVTRTLAARTRS